MVSRFKHFQKVIPASKTLIMLHTCAIPGIVDQLPRLLWFNRRFSKALVYKGSLNDNGDCEIVSVGHRALFAPQDG